jgi:hypothetical protein
LNLAWDARLSGDCAETLKYLSEISPASGGAPEVVELRAECLLETRRFPEAVELLKSAASDGVPDREVLLEELFGEWAAALTADEKYGDVRRIVAEGRSLVPGSLFLHAVERAASFRAEVRRAVGRRLRTVRLSSGEELLIAPRGSFVGRGWIRVYPWLGGASPVPRATLRDWMASLADRLDRRREALWVRVPERAWGRALRHEAQRLKRDLRPTPGGFFVVRGSERVFVDPFEWTFRAATEGLGVLGAAAAALAEADRELRDRTALVQWVKEQGGEFEVSRDEDLLRLRHRRSLRSYDLDLSAWAAAFDPASREWSAFWSDLLCDLEARPKPFSCSCGPPVVLREVLLAAGSSGAGDGPVVVEKGRGYELGLLAICPGYERYVTGQLLEDWGVGLSAAARRATADAVHVPWEIAFARGEADGAPYLLLEGEGVSSLAVRPSLLLGALERVEGADVRERTFTVVVPSAASLLVLPEPANRAAVRRASLRFLLDAARQGSLRERCWYLSRVRLPAKAEGSFRVRAP